MGITSESQIDLFESTDLTVDMSFDDHPLVQLIPDASFLLEGDYARIGFNLVITNPDGEQFVVEDYFAQQPPPNLMLANGPGLSPEMVKALLHQSLTEDVMFAGPAASAVAAIAIGTVKFVLGKVTAIGSNGEQRTLHKGDTLYKGDEIKTDGRGFIRVTMNDGTRFHLGKNARAILNDFEFNESASIGKFEVTVLIGGFHYKSGKIGTLNPGIKHSTIKTPSAFIGIRGSELDGTVAPNGQTIVIHKSGILEITDINGDNPIILDAPGNTSIIVLDGSPNYFETASPAVTQLVLQSLPPPDTSTDQGEETEEVEDEQTQEEVEDEAGVTDAAEQDADETAEAEAGEEGDEVEEDVEEEVEAEEEGAGEEGVDEEGIDQTEVVAEDSGQSGEDASEPSDTEVTDPEIAARDSGADSTEGDEAGEADQARSSGTADTGTTAEPTDPDAESASRELTPADEGQPESDAYAIAETGYSVDTGTGTATTNIEQTALAGELSQFESGGLEVLDGTEVDLDEEYIDPNFPPEVSILVGSQIAVDSIPFGLSIPAASFTDQDGPLLFLSMTDLPSGLNFDPVTNTVLGTPDPSAVGLHTVSLTATDPAGATATSRFEIRVVSLDTFEGNIPPILSVPLFNQTAIQNQPFSLTIPGNTFFDINNDPITYRLSGMPPGFAFDSGSNVLSGTASAPGLFNVTVNATDALGGSSRDEFVLDVIASNDPNNIAPQLNVPLFDQEAILGEAFDFVIPGDTFRDDDGDSLSIRVSGLPESFVFNVAANSITGAPDISDVGSYLIVVTASDGRGGIVEDEFFLDIFESFADNSEPFLVAPIFDLQIRVGDVLSLSLDKVFDDLDGDPLEYTVSGLPTSLFMEDFSNTIAGTARAEDVGSYLIEVTAFDGRGGSDFTEFFLDVISPGATAGNTPPFLVNPLFDQKVEEGTVVSASLEGTFADEDGDLLTYAVAGLPTSLFFDETTISIVGTPTELDLGSYLIEVTAFDGRGGSDFTEFFLDVVRPGTATGNTPPFLVEPIFDETVEVGETLFESVVGTFFDSDGDLLTYKVAGLPPSLFFDDQTNSVIGTPTELDLGSYLIEISAFDGRGGSGSTEFFLDVIRPGTTLGNTPPFQVDPFFDQTIEVGMLLSETVEGSFADNDGDFLTYRVAGLPPSLFFDDVTNIITGTPTESDLGSYLIEVSAFDGRGGSDFAQFFLDVVSPGASAGNTPPFLINALANQLVEEGTSVFLPLDGTFDDADGDFLTYVVAGLPTGLFFDSASTSIIGTATELDLGSFLIEVTAFDGRGGSDFTDFFLDVVSPGANIGNAAPFLFTPIGNQFLVAGENVLFPLLDRFADPDGDSLSFTVSGGPPSLFLDEINSSIVGTVGAADVGTWFIEIAASDGRGGSVIANFNLDVVANSLPIANNDAFSGIEDSPLTIRFPGVLGNDSDPDFHFLEVTLLTGTAFGSISLATDGSFDYIPNAGFTGTDSFTYQVIDEVGGTDTAVATIFIDPTGSNSPPFANNDEFYTIKNTLLNISAPGVLFNDSDPNFDPLTASLLTSPTQGTVSLAADGQFIYTPLTDFTGTDVFSYRVSDGQGGFDEASVSVFVEHTSTTGVANNDYFPATENITLSVASPGLLENDGDLDGTLTTIATVSSTPVTSPANGSLDVLNPDGSFIYTPNPGFTGTDSFTYRLIDGGFTDTATVLIGVWPPGMAFDDYYGTTENISLSTTAFDGVLANDDDLDNTFTTTPTVTPLAGPGFGTLALSPDGSFTYAPNPGFTGSDSFTYRLNDGTATDTATVFIDVWPPPMAWDDYFSTTENTTLVITALDGVLVNDADLDGNFTTTATVTPLAAPSFGTLNVLNPDGSFTYTPNPGFTGTDSFTYRLSDGGVTDTATVSIGVWPPPMAWDDFFSGTENFTLVISAPGLLVNDDDLDGTFTTTPTVDGTAVVGPSFGTLDVLNPDGSFIYTPNTGFTGTDSFTYRLVDGGVTDTAIVSIGVWPPPMAWDDSFSTTESITLVISAPGVLGNDDDLDGTFTTTPTVDGTAVIAPSFGTLGALNPDGSFIYTPNTGFTGTDSFTYRVIDGGVTDTANVFVFVAPSGGINPPPIFVSEYSNFLASEFQPEFDGTQTGDATNGIDALHFSGQINLSGIAALGAIENIDIRGIGSGSPDLQLGDLFDIVSDHSRESLLAFGTQQLVVDGDREGSLILNGARFGDADGETGYVAQDLFGIGEIYTSAAGFGNSLESLIHSDLSEYIV